MRARADGVEAAGGRRGGARVPGEPVSHGADHARDAVPRRLCASGEHYTYVYTTDNPVLVGY